MILNKIRVAKLVAIFVISFVATGTTSAYAQKPKGAIVTKNSRVAELRAAVEARPNSLKAHEAYIKTVGIDNPKLIAQYEQWMKKYPKSAMVPYAIGKSFKEVESPKAKSYLLKTVAINPKLTNAWECLWIDAERWGDFELANEYLRMALESDPSNAANAFSYASSFKGKNEEKYREMSLDVAKRFPSSDSGAQSLYWLANGTSDRQYKVKIFELLKSSYSPEKFGWSANGMESYYDLLLDLGAEKAANLAKEMAKIKSDYQKSWVNHVKIAENVVEIKKMIEEKKGAEALALIRATKLPKYFDFSNNMPLLKAEALSILINDEAAYDSLIVSFIKTPTVLLKNGISTFGSKIGKDSSKVEYDIWKKIDVVSKQATPFKLKNYFTNGMTSLSDYQGKVVLLTYWFPGCGPCRGEFPHFENVIRKFKGQAVDYVGINIEKRQNDYVIPFLKKSKYSFTPLEDVEGRAKGNLDNRDLAPINFLIDKNGRIIFSDFRIDESNEDQLEMMINLVLKYDRD